MRPTGYIYMHMHVRASGACIPNKPSIRIHPSITFFRAQPRKYNAGLYKKGEKRESEIYICKAAAAENRGLALHRGLFGLLGRAT